MKIFKEDSILLLVILMFRPSSGFINRQCNDKIRANRSLLLMSSNSAVSTIKVLALHGSGGNGDEFWQKLQPLREYMIENHQVELEIQAPTAPFVKGEDGYCWWTMAPGARSFNAIEYIGFQESSQMVLEKMNDCDLVLAHSQGAILMSALLGLHTVAKHPSRGYILNGVAWPNPYSKKLASAQLCGEDVRALFIMGEVDKINPIESAIQVRQSLIVAGCNVVTHKHGGGHSFPSKDEASLQVIAEWLNDNATSTPAK
mmetsp:Transcript_25943/g.39259  ORF Transcript_25943/g.39259 Transcript_25943/m.39259 type:complete len:258 (+) Transcript_25943:78-851(+)|eukprot:CAMPEP_0178900606 /NCGR_PEP_ID=MMETSP0786-20121207/3562_1 /TAXON_ID=186022 /ORGANISM="Thalassionema frauenfeldii, Strain CCMP 1798" /LENGTH=257 /DNA_ID=CAMNT_0020571619 /DNA_START=76 /DNA_END=849 /DNA_ORIENTATION=-